MRKLMFFVAAFCLFAILPNAKAISLWYSNETAETTTINNVAYWNNPTYAYDGAWDTFGDAAGTVNFGIMTLDYRKPIVEGYNLSWAQSKWEIKNGIGTYNLTINESCWNYNATHIKLRARTGRPDVYYSYFDCYDGVYQNLLTSTDSSVADNIYEEKMWWKFTAPAGWLALNFSQTVQGTYTFSNQTTATSFNTYFLELNLSEYPTGDVVILLENQSISFDNTYASFQYNVTLLNGTIKWQKYKVMTSDAIGLSGAFVKVFDAATNGLIFSGFSEDSGYIYVPLNLMKPYRFIAELEGYNNYTETRYVYTAEDTEEQIMMVKPGTIYDYWRYYDKISYSCTGNVTATDVNCTATDTSGLVSQFCLNVGRWTLTGFVNRCYVCNSTTTSSIMGCDINDTTGNKTYTYQLVAAFPDGSEYLLYNGLISFISGAAIYGLTGVFIALMLVLTMAFVGLWSPSASIVGGMIGLVASVWLNLIILSPVIVVGIMIVGAIIVVRGRY